MGDVELTYFYKFVDSEGRFARTNQVLILFLLVLSQPLYPYFLRAIRRRNKRKSKNVDLISFLRMSCCIYRRRVLCSAQMGLSVVAYSDVLYNVRCKISWVAALVSVQQEYRNPRNLPFHFVLTSSIARRITSASVMPSLVACFTIHACWEAVRTIWRWMPFIGSSFRVANSTSLPVYCIGVKC